MCVSIFIAGVREIIKFFQRKPNSVTYVQETHWKRSVCLTRFKCQNRKSENSIIVNNMRNKTKMNPLTGIDKHTSSLKMESVCHRLRFESVFFFIFVSRNVDFSIQEGFQRTNKLKLPQIITQIVCPIQRANRHCQKTKIYINKHSFQKDC